MPGSFGNTVLSPTYTYKGKTYTSKAAYDAAVARDRANQTQANTNTVVDSQTVDPNTGLRQDGTPAPVATTTPGTQVYNYVTGQNYTAGGVNDPNAFSPIPNLVPAGLQKRQDMIGNLLTTSQQRPAPQAQTVTVDPLQQAQVATLSPLQTAQSTQLRDAALGTAAKLGPVAQASGGGGISAGTAAAAKLGPAERAQAASIDPLERARQAQLSPLQTAQESAFRNQQQQAIDYQQRLMTGENSIAALQAKRQGDTLMRQQMAMAASARPGQGGLAQRVAAQQQARLGADLAGRTLEAQLAERNAAAQQFGAMVGTARGQDLTLNQFNAAAANQQNQFGAGLEQQTNLANSAAFNLRAQQQAALQQETALQNATEANRQAQVGAQLGTQASIANAQNATQASIASGQIGAQLGMFNAGQANAQTLAQAQMAQQMSLANQQAQNERAYQQAAMAQQNSQFNAGQGNQYNLAAAQMLQQGNQFNAGQANQYNLANAQLAQQGNQFNVGAQLQQQGMNDQMLANLMSQQLGGLNLQQQGLTAGAQMTQQQQLAIAQMINQQRLAQMGIDANKAAQPGLGEKIIGGIIGGATTALPFLV